MHRPERLVYIRQNRYPFFMTQIIGVSENSP
jgi:hypothetical protein